MIFLAGGPPHMDMFDMKPDAPPASGANTSRSLPMCRASTSASTCRGWREMMDKFTVIRSLVGAADDHSAGQCLTGYRDRISKAQGGRPSLGISRFAAPGAGSSRCAPVYRTLAPDG